MPLNIKKSSSYSTRRILKLDKLGIDNVIRFTMGFSFNSKFSYEIKLVLNIQNSTYVQLLSHMHTEWNDI